LWDTESQTYDYSRFQLLPIGLMKYQEKMHRFRIIIWLLQGGSEAAKYLLSFGYFDQAGTINFTGVKKYTFRLNNDLQLKDWLTVGSNLNLGFSRRKAME
jgi:hypothetical protein